MVGIIVEGGEQYFSESTVVPQNIQDILQATELAVNHVFGAASGEEGADDPSDPSHGIVIPTQTWFDLVNAGNDWEAKSQAYDEAAAEVARLRDEMNDLGQQLAEAHHAWNAAYDQALASCISENFEP